MAKVKMPTPEDISGMWQASGLKEKLIFTFLIIAVFRLGAQIPIFGIDSEAFKSLAGGTNIIGFIDMFTGGALGKVSVFALGIGPYITASIIMQLIAVVIPPLEKLQKEEGDAGRRKISQYTRYLTLGLALFQSLVLILFIYRQTGTAIILPDLNPILVFAGALICLTAGAILVMWFAELITERGLGNGGSLLIFVGILSQIPVYMKSTAAIVAGNPPMQLALVILLSIFLATILFIVVMQEAIRKIIVVNAKRQVGNKVYGGVNTHIPFKLNPGGVMPIIFAIAILLFPATVLDIMGKEQGMLSTIATFVNTEIFSPAKLPYYVIYFLLIFSLTFFYASIMPNMQPKEIANNLKKHGSSIPGVKPGKPTADLLDKILSRTTFIGAIGLGLIALIPMVASALTGITSLQGIGATSLIIMVGVALDFINQIKTHLLVRQYEGFLK